MAQNNISSDTDLSYQDGAPFLERVMFANRELIIVISILLTIFLGYQMLQMKPEGSFLRMIPTYHPYIKNYIAHKEDLKGLGNMVRICVETTNGEDIFTEEYFEVLKQITDEVFFVSGVNRAGLKSLWMPIVRWTEVTEDGFDGGSVIPDTYNGSPQSLNQVRLNVLKSGQVGRLVANDFKSSVIVAPLHDLDPETGEPLDYQVFSDKLEEIRNRFQKDGIRIKITGFAKIVGDLIDGLDKIMGFFFLALVIMLGLLYHNSRSWRVTILRGIKSMMAVIWQLGILHLMGYGLNPYSILVPFLIFAIGVSHGIQFFNAMGHEMIKGADKIKAARLGYRLIYKPGLAALFTDCIGFATLMVIRIGVIQDIAIGASIGIAVVAVTDLTILPIMMSYVGINKKTIDILRVREAGTEHPMWSFLSRFTRWGYANAAIIIALLGLTVGIYMRQDLKTGDLDPGAPELRPHSRYNQDNAYMNDHYSASSDLFVVMLKTPREGNSEYSVVAATDKLDWLLTRLPGVQTVKSHSDNLKLLNAAFSEGNLKWMALPRSKAGLSDMVLKVPLDFMTRGGYFTPILIYLDDHKAETLERVVETVEEFAQEHNTETYQFIMAAGNAGIEAATNIEVEKALIMLTLLVYAVVFLVCWVTYRDVRGALCVVTPLVLTSVLCEALMAKMGIGVKVATLPVIAVGVGIGVDYGIYIYNKLVYYRAKGLSLNDAYYQTLNTTGRAVSFTGITLAIGVTTWFFSPIKFQADMGFLLLFMFLWNMVGAMVLLPALARYLLVKDKV